MGYRSDVAIAMSKELMDDLFKAAAEKDKSAENSRVLELLGYGNREEITIGQNEDQEQISILRFEYIKWYENIDQDVDFVMDFVRNSEEYDYVRVGEGVSDIEEEQNLDVLYVDNSIITCNDWAKDDAQMLKELLEKRLGADKAKLALESIERLEKTEPQEIQQTYKGLMR